MGVTPPFDGHMTLLTTLPTSSAPDPNNYKGLVNEGTSACDNVRPCARMECRLRQLHVSFPRNLLVAKYAHAVRIYSQNSSLDSRLDRLSLWATFWRGSIILRIARIANNGHVTILYNLIGRSYAGGVGQDHV